MLYRWHSMVPDVLNLNGGLTPDKYRFNNEVLERVGAEAVIAAASRQPVGRIMVAVDAFSRVFTNPLLSFQCFELASAFGFVGMRIYRETTSLEDIVKRNAPLGANVLARFRLQP